jgi:hypothetical protein
VLVSEIATRVKRQFGDEAGVQVTDADIIRWVNDAQREIAVKNNLLQVRATTAVSPGVNEIAAPTDILTLHAVRFQGIKLIPLSQQEADQFDLGAVPTTSRSTPTHFWRWANTITLYPAPNITDPDDITLFYTRIPVEITATNQTPELPAQYHNRIVEYAIAQAAELDENLQQYQLKMGQFESGVAELKGQGEYTEQDFYPSISVGSADLTYNDSDLYLS